MHRRLKIDQSSGSGWWCYSDQSAGNSIWNFMKSHYDTLEVSPHASNAVIRAAYRCLVQHHHPDKNPQDLGAGQKIADFNQAYSILSNIEKRKKYDLYLGIEHISRERRGDAACTFNERKFSENGANTIRPFAFRPLD